MSQEPDMLQDGQQGLGAYKAHESARLRCPGCGESFVPVRKGQKHCRPSCRARASERHRGLMPLLPWDRPAGEHQRQTERVRAYFVARPNQDISGWALSLLGYGGWRTEVSRLRHAPWHLPICRAFYKPMVLGNGKRVRMSYYRLELPAETQAAVREAEAVV